MRSPAEVGTGQILKTRESCVSPDVEIVVPSHTMYCPHTADVLSTHRQCIVPHTGNVLSTHRRCIVPTQVMNSPHTGDVLSPDTRSTVPHTGNVLSPHTRCTVPRQIIYCPPHSMWEKQPGVTITQKTQSRNMMICPYTLSGCSSRQPQTISIEYIKTRQFLSHTHKKNTQNKIDCSKSQVFQYLKQSQNIYIYAWQHLNNSWYLAN